MAITSYRPHGANGAGARPGIHRRGWTVCCSGGGIRSAAYSLGGLQRLREENFGTNPDDLVVGVSGGSYIAAAMALADHDRGAADPRPFKLGSDEEERLRNSTHYLAPDGKTLTAGLLSLCYGSVAISLILIAPVLAAAHALGWLYRWADVLIVPGGKSQPAVHVTDWWWWGWPAAATLAFLVLFAVWHWHANGPRHPMHTQAVGWLATATAVLAVAMMAVPFVIQWMYGLITLHVPGVVVTAGPLSLMALLSTLVALVRSGFGQVRQRAEGLKDMPEAATSLLGKVGGWARRVLLPWLAVAAIGFVTALLALMWVHDGAAFGVRPFWQWLPVAVAAGIVLAGRFTDVNRLSMHDFYRWRLAAGYGRERTMRLSGLRGSRLVLAATANINAPGETAGQGAACLTFTPRQVTLWAGPGHRYDAATSDMELMADPARMSVFDIVALSGAALSPLMGRATRAAFRLPMTVANVRLGQWLPSPSVVARARQYLDRPQQPGQGAIQPRNGRDADQRRDEGAVRPIEPLRRRWWLLLWYATPHVLWAVQRRAGDDKRERNEDREAFLWAKLLQLRTDADRHVPWRKLQAQVLYRWLQPTLGLLWAETLGHCSYRQTWMYVTDGGHYDNLGLVAALRGGHGIDYPRNDRIVVLDASGDRTDHWSTIGGAIALARVDAGVTVDLDPSVMRPARRQDPATPRLKKGEVRRPWASGSFEAADGQRDRRLWVCKLGWWREASWDIRAYAAAHPSYPCDSTAHQLYDADEFEAYRALGYEAVGDAIEHGHLQLEHRHGLLAWH